MEKNDEVLELVSSFKAPLEEEKQLDQREELRARSPNTVWLILLLMLKR